MSRAGRNDPCPCGSGKKFKKCCLEKTVAAAREAGAARVVGAGGSASPRESALARLLDFSFGPEFDGGHGIAQALFWAGRLQGRSAEEVRSVMELEQTEINYNAWFLFDRDIEDGRTVVDLFLDREGARLPAAEREYLERVRGTYLGIYEVEEVEPEKGLRLTDLWTGERVSVREQMATRQLVRWDLLAARVMQEAGGEHVLEGGGYLYPARAKGEILGFLRRQHRTFARRVPGADVRAFLKQSGMLFHHLWLDHVAFPPRPRMTTVEGDEVMPARAIFDVRDRDTLVAALGRHPDLVGEGEGTYVWGEEAEEFHRTLGTFRLTGDRLVLEAMSKERAERGRRVVEAAAGEAVRYRVTEYEDLGQAMKRVAASPKPPAGEPQAPAIPPEVEAELLREFQDRHYRKWVDEPIPALGNRTPRHAASLKTVRPKLVDLLKEMENHEARAARAGRVSYDLTWIWKELGLERP